MARNHDALEDIRRLTFEYARAVDGQDLEGVVALFTEDALWDARGFGMPEMKGRDDIRAFYTSIFENVAHCAHLTLNHLVEVDGDTATGHVYIHALAVARDGTRSESIGYYDDTYVRTDSGWRFSSRAAQPLLPPPPPAV